MAERGVDDEDSEEVEEDVEREYAEWTSANDEVRSRWKGLAIEHLFNTVDEHPQRGGAGAS